MPTHHLLIRQVELARVFRKNSCNLLFGKLHIVLHTLNNGGCRYGSTALFDKIQAFSLKNSAVRNLPSCRSAHDHSLCSRNYFVQYPNALFSCVIAIHQMYHNYLQSINPIFSMQITACSSTITIVQSSAPFVNTCIMQFHDNRSGFFGLSPKHPPTESSLTVHSR